MTNIFAWLGGFHWLMSAMGSLGFLMSVSGLDYLFKNVYADATVPHLMSGHVYSLSICCAHKYID